MKKNLVLKIVLLFTAVFGIVLCFKIPPTNAEQVETKYQKDTIKDIPVIDFNKINQSINNQIGEIKQEKIETTKAIARLTKDNKALQSEVIKLNNIKQKIDTVLIIQKEIDTVKVEGKNYKTNVFGKKKLIKNK